MTERDEVVRNLPNSNLQGFLKTSFDHWKIYTIHKLRRKCKTGRAVNFHNLCLMRKAINSLLQNCVEADKSSGSLSRRARTFQRRSISKRNCHLWQTFTINRHQRSPTNCGIFDLDNADDFQAKRLNVLQSKRFFSLWMNHRNSQSIENQKWNIVCMHWHRKLLRKAWFAWIEYQNAKYRGKSKMKDSCKFYNQKLLARCLKALVSNLHQNTIKQRRLEKMRNHSKRKLLSNIFRAWLSYCRVERAIKDKIIAQREKIHFSSKQKSLKKWRLWVRYKKCCRRKNNLARSHYDRSLLMKSVVSLKIYWLYHKEKAIRLDYLGHGTALITLEILRVYIDLWRVSVVRITQERQKNHCAEDHWSFHQTQRYFNRWKLFCERHKSKGIRKCVLVKIGEVILLEKYLNLWFSKYKSLEPIRVKEIQVASRYVIKLQSYVFRSWKKYASEKALRRNELVEAHKYHKKFLLREGLQEILKFCLRKIESRYELRSRCVRRNSADNFDTMKKFFAKWLAYVYTNGSEDPDRSKRENNNRRISEFPYASTTTRLILPEYMLKHTNMDNSDNNLFIEGFGGACEYNGNKGEYTSVYSTRENSPSVSENAFRI